MYQKSQVLPPNLPHHQKMIFEMELRGYSQHTKDHYLGHLRLLEKHTNKSATQITPDELRNYLHDRIQSGIGYSSITISCSAFKLFFNKVLGYNWSDMSATQITPDELRNYLHDRIQSGIGYSSITISCSAFKLFFNKVLGYNWSDDVIIRPKKPKSLPHVLSKDEILSITDQVQK